MEGVGARLGRSSSRYNGPAVVFSGRVRKWKKKWVNVPSPNSTSNNHHHNTNTTSSHLILFKWTPVNPPAAANGSGSSPSTPAKDSDGSLERKRVRYMPISVAEDQKQETTTKVDDESEDNITDAVAHTENSNSDADINDIIMQESKDADNERAGSHEGASKSKTHLDLNLGLKSHDGKHEHDRIQNVDNSIIKSSETQSRGKRKAPDLEMRM